MSGQDRVLKVASPLRGWCASLDDSPDPVFSGRMLGDGVSIDLTAGELHAPFDAEVLVEMIRRYLPGVTETPRATGGAPQRVFD